MFQNATRCEERRRSASQPPMFPTAAVVTATAGAPLRSERAESTSSSGEQRGGYITRELYFGGKFKYLTFQAAGARVAVVPSAIRAHWAPRRRMA